MARAELLREFCQRLAAALFAGVLFVSLASCIPPRWHRIEPGMTKEEVRHFVGEPTRRTYDDDVTNGKIETWYYDYYDPHDRHFEPHWIRFNRERVLLSEYDAARFEEVRRQKLVSAREKKLEEQVPPDAGFPCQQNDQCTSKKCVSHRCTGPDGCTRGPGDECYSDLDCCSRHCLIGSRTCG